MSHRRKTKDLKKAEFKTRDAVDPDSIVDPRIIVDVPDPSTDTGKIPIPESLKKSRPYVSFNVDEGMVEYGSTLDLVDIFEDCDGDLHYTFASGNVSVTISRPIMKMLLENTD